MVSVYSVDAYDLIKKVSQELKKTDLVHPPEWAQFVKTGVFKQRPPVDEDWWYIRAAAILRSVYKLGPVGVAKLRTKYGGKQNRGVRPEKFRVGSGNIIRTILQQLEKEGLVASVKDEKKKGRVITPKGQSLLDKVAISLAKPSKTKKEEKKPEIKKEKSEAKSENEEKAEEKPKAEKSKKEEKVEE